MLDLKVVTTPQTQYRDNLDRAITAAEFFATAANREVRCVATGTETTFVAEEVEFNN